MKKICFSLLLFSSFLPFCMEKATAQPFPRSNDLQEIATLKKKHALSIAGWDCSAAHMKAYALTLDKTNPLTISYLENYLRQASKYNFSDEMFFTFLDYIDAVTSDSTAAFYLLPQKLKKVRRFLGIKLQPSLTNPTLHPDIHYLSNVLNDKGSEELHAYLKQAKKETDSPILQNGEMQISFSKLLKRMLFWDNFMEEYPDFAGASRVVNQYNHYLQLLLQGSRNTRVFDPNTEKLNPKMAKLYQEIARKYPDSHTGKAVDTYFRVLKEHDFIFSNRLTRVLDEVMMKLPSEKQPS